MQRLSQIAAPAVLGVSLLVGTAGCSHERPLEVPSSATMAVEGNERLAYAAPHDGTVYLYDVGNDQIIYSGAVREGDEVVLDPKENKLTVAGRTAFEKGIDRGHRHRLFFDSDSTDVKTTHKKVVEEERTVRESRDAN